MKRIKKFGLAMLLMGFCLTLFLNQFFSNEYDPKIQLYAVLYQIAVNVTDGVQEVLEKYLLQYKYQHFLTILFLQGLFDTLILCGILLYLIIVNQYTLAHWVEINIWLKKNLKQLIAYSFASFGYHFCRLNINEKMSPTHRIISDSLYAILSVYYFLIGNFSFGDFIISFRYLISFCGSLVYHQILVVKVCGALRTPNM